MLILICIILVLLNNLIRVYNIAQIDTAVLLKLKWINVIQYCSKILVKSHKLAILKLALYVVFSNFIIFNSETRKRYLSNPYFTQTRRLDLYLKVYFVRLITLILILIYFT